MADLGTLNTFRSLERYPQRIAIDFRGKYVPTFHFIRKREYQPVTKELVGRPGTIFVKNTDFLVNIKRYYVSGAVTEQGNPVSRFVKAYDQETGLFLGGVWSDATTGNYRIDFIGYSGLVTVVAFDSPSGLAYNALVASDVVPTLVT